MFDDSLDKRFSKAGARTEAACKLCESGIRTPPNFQQIRVV